MVEIRIEKSKGYSGKRSGKSYVAAIVGTNPTYRFEREFLDPDKIEWPDNFAWGRKPKATRTDVYRVGEGLYELVEYDERSYLIVWVKNGELVRTNIDVERAVEIARLLDDGQDFESARRATRKETVNAGN